MSQYVPKCPIQTHRCQNGLISLSKQILSITFSFPWSSAVAEVQRVSNTCMYVFLHLTHRMLWLSNSPSLLLSLDSPRPSLSISFTLSFIFFLSLSLYFLLSQSRSLNLRGPQVLCCGYMGSAAATFAIGGNDNNNNGFMGNFFAAPKGFDEKAVSPGGKKNEKEGTKK